MSRFGGPRFLIVIPLCVGSVTNSAWGFLNKSLVSDLIRIVQIGVGAAGPQNVNFFINISMETTCVSFPFDFFDLGLGWWIGRVGWVGWASCAGNLHKTYVCHVRNMHPRCVWCAMCTYTCLCYKRGVHNRNDTGMRWTFTFLYHLAIPHKSARTNIMNQCEMHTNPCTKERHRKHKLYVREHMSEHKKTKETLQKSTKKAAANKERNKNMYCGNQPFHKELPPPNKERGWTPPGCMRSLFGGGSVFH